MKKILVIEDEAITRNLFLDSLKAEGFHAIGAENGQVGVEQAKEKLPNLVICDIKMPELDGYGVLANLRKDPATAIIPFIFLTAKVTETERRQGMRLGADDYLTKPSTIEELLEAIAVRLEKQNTLQQCYAAKFHQGIDESTGSETPPKAVSQSIFPSVPQLNEVFDFIENHYHQRITLTDVAQAVGYSPAYLTNRVGSQTGQTVNRWIVERRMVAARSLLEETNQSVEQIAVAVGYQNPCHFSRQFRQYHDTTPQGWRRKCQAALSD